MMRFGCGRRTPLIAGAAALLLSIGNPLVAKDDVTTFLKLLQTGQRKPTDRPDATKLFPELAVDYLQYLVDSNRVPESLKEDIDFHLAEAMSLAAQVSVAEREKKLLDEALKRYQKYRAEHPSTDESIDARRAIAYINSSRAEKLLGLSKMATKPEEAAAKRKEAREKFEQSRAELSATIDQYKEALAESRKGAPKPGKGRKASSAGRAETLEGAMVDAELRRGQVDFLIGLTYDRSDKAEKVKATEHFEAAAKAFDDLFQRYRATGAPIASYSLLWEGRVKQELGDYALAETMFREILGREPDQTNRTDGIDFELFSQARLFWCQTQNLAGKPDEVLDHKYYSAPDWVNKNQRHRRKRVGLGIQLEAAKAYIALAVKQAEGSKERKRLIRDAMKILNDDVCRYASEYQLEGFALREKYSKEVRGTEEEMSSFAEASTTGDTSLGSEDWAAAIAAYEKALSMVKRDTPADAVSGVKYKLAYAHSKAGNTEKCAEVAESLARQTPPAKASADGGGLALGAYWKLYSQEKDAAAKQGLADKLISLADYIEQRFPMVEQADYARYLKGFVYATMKKFAESAAAYGSISPQAKNYAEGQLRSGQMYWVSYRLAQQDGGKGSLEAVEKANAALVLSAAAYEELGKKEGGGKPTGWIEANLKRAEIALKTGKGEEAGQIAAPLVELVQKGEPEGINKYAVDILVTALEAAIATRSLDRADQLVDVVLESDRKQGAAGGGQITTVLVRLGGSFRDQIETLEKAGKPVDAKTMRGEFERFLNKIATRGSQSFLSLRFIGESYFALGEMGKAAGMFAQALELIEKDPNAVPAETRDKTILSLRLRRLGALRDSGQFAEGLKIIEGLLADHAKAAKETYPLAYEMEKAQLLGAWAEKDTSKGQAALDQWNGIANKLRAAKPPRKEYFEARYGIAAAFARMGKKESAIQTLRSTMALSPECGGAEIKQKFTKLLGELEGPATAKGGG